MSTITTNRPAMGLDLSHVNGDVNDIDLHAIHAAGYGFLIFKATEGHSFADPRFPGWYKRAKALDFFVMAYHFLRADSPIAEQMTHLLTVLRSIGYGVDDGIPWVDCEKNVDINTIPNAEQAAQALTAVSTAIQRPAGIYCNRSDYETIYKPIVKDNHLWVASYGEEHTVPYLIWQHTDKQVVPGVYAPCDANYLHLKITMADFKAKCALTKAI